MKKCLDSLLGNNTRGLEAFYIALGHVNLIKNHYCITRQKTCHCAAGKFSSFLSWMTWIFCLCMFIITAVLSIGMG